MRWKTIQLASENLCQAGFDLVNLAFFRHLDLVFGIKRKLLCGISCKLEQTLVVFTNLLVFLQEQ